MKKRVIAAVLAGGLGTRLRPLTLKIPKPLVPVNRKPFISFVLENLASHKIRECVILTGYKHEMIQKFCKDGKRWGLQIRYSHEPYSLGTGGAVVFARKMLNETSLVLNGDTFADFDFRKFLSFHRKRRADASIYCMYGSLKSKGAVKVSNTGKVVSFAEKQKEGFGYFNTGVYLLEPEVLEFFSEKIESGQLPKNFSIEKEGFPLLMKKGGLYAYFGGGRFLDIGTFEGLEKAVTTLKADWVQSNLKKHQGAAVFLDRDGVINRHKSEYVRHPDEFEFEEGAIEGIKKLSKARLPIFIVTNQSMIGRGIATKEILDKIHKKMLSVLGRHKIRIADILVCPHKPDDNCNCRKPKIGMLIDAKERFGVDLDKSFVVGDSTGDIAMGNHAGCITILVSTGHGGNDRLHATKPDFICKNLKEAAHLIEKLIKKT